MKRLVLLLVILVALSAIVVAGDSTQVLARILREKGVLTSAELARVEAAPPEDGVRVLAAILQQKGLLSETEALRVTRGESASGAVTAQNAALSGAVSAQNVAGTGAKVIPAVAVLPAQQMQAAQKAETPPPPPVTSDSRLPITLYGTLLLNAGFNTATTNNQDVPLLAGKQGADSLGNDKSFAMTARGTRLGMRYRGPSLRGATVYGQFEFDMFGGKPALSNGMNMDLLRLRLAFGRLEWNHFGLEAGQDWSVFAPLNPVSLAGFAIPEFSASGNPWIRTPQFRFDAHSDSKAATRVLWQLAATDPDIGDYPATFATLRTPGIGERGRMPALDSRLGVIHRTHERDFSAGFSTHYGRAKNAGTIGTLTVQEPFNSWGLAADYSLPVARRLTLSGEVFTGRALGIFSVASGLSVLPLGTPGAGGVESHGGWAQVEINLAARWQAHLAYGMEANNPRQMRTGDRWRNQNYMTNIYYKYSPRVIFAWEWRRFVTDFLNQRNANERGDHFNMAIAYVF